MVSTDLLWARSFITDRRQLYRPYESLVDSGSRLPAKFADDAHRRIVSGALFPSNADKICYGALSLGDIGLPSYGQVHLRLRDVAVKRRVSFLDSNSYAMIGAVTKVPPEIPAGLRSGWDNRNELAACKAEQKLAPDLNDDAFPKLLVQSDEGDRSKDDFIEAHIYGQFTSDAVESVNFTGLQSRQERMDARAMAVLLEKTSGAQR